MLGVTRQQQQQQLQLQQQQQQQQQQSSLERIPSCSEVTKIENPFCLINPFQSRLHLESPFENDLDWLKRKLDRRLRTVGRSETVAACVAV